MQATCRAQAWLLTLVTWPCGRRVCVVVVFVWQAVVVVDGRPGLLVVVGVACGRCGGRARRCG